MRGELDAARKSEADLRGELAATGSRSNSSVDRFRAEIAQLLDEADNHQFGS